MLPLTRVTLSRVYAVLLQIHDPDEALCGVTVFLPLLLALRGSHAGLGGTVESSC